MWEWHLQALTSTHHGFSLLVAAPHTFFSRFFVSQEMCSPATCASTAKSYLKQCPLLLLVQSARLDGQHWVTPKPRAPVVTRVLTRGQACRVADDIPYYRNAGTQATTCGGNAQECNSVWNRVSMLWPTCTSPPLSVPLESLQGIWRWGCFGVFCELTVSFCGCDLCLSSLLFFLYALALHHPHQRITFSQSLHLGLTCGWGKKFVYGLI